MKKKIFAVVLCLIVLTSAIVPAYAVSPDFDVPAKFIYLVNTDTDTVVYEKNAEERAIPASLTKIMTAIIALQKTQNLDAMDIKAPGYIYNEFYGIGVSNAEIARGEVFTMRELLYALMLNSACEAASIIADYVGGGSIPSFVEMMNEKAKEIGALNTNFVNAHGLYDENQYTTAHDMYLITKYALEQPGFLEIANTKNYTIEGNELRTTKNLVHTNRMLFSTSNYYMPEIKGIKTGTLEEAGRNLITIADSEGYHYLCVVMGGEYSDSASHYKATQALYEWAFDTFRVKTLLESKRSIAEVPVKLSSETDHVLLTSSRNVTALVPVNIESSSVVLQTELPEYVKAPVQKGDILGKGRVLLLGEEIAQVDLIAMEDIKRSAFLHFTDTLHTVTSRWQFFIGAIVFVALLLLYIVLSVAYNNYKRRQRKASPYSSGYSNYESYSSSSKKTVHRRKL